MAGYTRQSSSSIVNTLDITAAPLNAEFNQVQTAFGTSGHTHTGSRDGPKIPLSTSVSGYLPAANGGTSGKNNFSATADPLVTDDVDLGYAVGSLWINTTTDRMHVCADNTDGAAVWRAISHISAADGALVPDATDTKRHRTLNNRWQDLHLSGAQWLEVLPQSETTLLSRTTVLQLLLQQPLIIGAKSVEGKCGWCNRKYYGYSAYYGKKIK